MSAKVFTPHLSGLRHEGKGCCSRRNTVHYQHPEAQGASGRRLVPPCLSIAKHNTAGNAGELTGAETSDNIHLFPPAEGGFQPQAFVPARTWFAARMHKNAPWALTGCSMSPGFHFDDFELAAREPLIQQYPQHRDIIAELTRQ